MRTSRIALASCTALLGLGTLVSQALPAAAQPPKQGTILLDQSGDTLHDFTPAPPTTKPMPKPEIGDFQIATPPVVDPPLPPKNGFPDFDISADTHGAEVQDPTGPGDGQCIPGTTVDPDCLPCTPVPGGPSCPTDDPCRPDNEPGPRDEDCPPPGDECPPPHAATAQIPPGNDCDEPCDERPNPTPRERGEDCDDPCDERPTPSPRDRGDEDCDDPCRPEGTDGPIARERGDDDCDDPCIPGGADGGTDGGPTRSRDEDCPGEGTTGGDDGGTDGPDRGRLPHTGGDIAVFLGAGLGLTALGTALRKVASR